MAECLTSQFQSPGAYYAASSYAEKPSALSKPGQPTVLSETRGSIAFSGCPRGNIVRTRFSAALSGTTFRRETHPRRSTAKQCSIRRRREPTRQEPARPLSGQTSVPCAYADFFNLFRSYSSPRFHSARTMAASFRAIFTRAISGEVPF
jgi:hypothetical protein